MHISRSLKFKKTVLPWFFALPGLLGAFIFRYYFMFQTLRISLHDYDITKPPGDFIGLDNYIRMFANADFWNAWKNTIIFVGLYLILIFPLPILHAICLSEIKKGRGIFATIYLLPGFIPLSVLVIIWRWIWNPNNFGMANQIISSFGFPAQAWLGNPSLTKFSIIFTLIISGGFSIMLYLSAILGISNDIYEAAQIDGCSGFRKIFYITLPNIKFLVLIQLIIAIINQSQLLDLPFQLTRGGPNGASTSIAIYIFDQITGGRVEYGGAMSAAATLGLVVFIITMVQLRINNSERD
ncbi:MAG: binding-protein-dependent transport system inner rane component [Lachnospiraceae bacterium]|jgi:multiple sugar transport system permease protein|nr:binding-protein-dependent transport system inner rane component [Lachnospiraceae bacterium]